MLNKTRIFTVAAAVALAIAASPGFAATVNYDFGPASGQSFGSGGSASSVTIDGATFTQANAATASYSFFFGPNGYNFTNIGGGAGTVLTTGGYAGVTPSGAPASVTISFATTMYGINFNYGNGDADYAPNGGDTLTATIGGTPVASVNPMFSSSNGDTYAEGAFSYYNANGFNSITLTSTDSAGAEDLVLGDLTTATAPVPLPPSIWLLGGGLAALGFKRRARAAA
jgi:hypothetical protein